MVLKKIMKNNKNWVKQKMKLKEMMMSLINAIMKKIALILIFKMTMRKMKLYQKMMMINLILKLIKNGERKIPMLMKYQAMTNWEMMKKRGNMMIPMMMNQWLRKMNNHKLRKKTLTMMKRIIENGY